MLISFEICEVVPEIHRLLRPEGLAYAEATFMQQFHEFQHDLFRVLHSAHRWLLQGCDELKSGPVGGATTALNWSIRYMVSGVPHRVEDGSRITSLRFAWLRLLNGPGLRRRHLDSARGL